MDQDDDAVDDRQRYEEAQERRGGQARYTSVWSPRMTEQQRKEFEQYVKEHRLPF